MQGRKASRITPGFWLEHLGRKSLFYLASTLLLFFSCPTFSVSIYSRLLTLISPPEPEEKSSALCFPTFLPAGDAGCCCCGPHSPSFLPQRLFSARCRVCSYQLPLQGCPRESCSTLGAVSKYICAFLRELPT